MGKIGEFDNLKSKQRALRDGFPPNVGLRVHRAISWLGRAERETDDRDAAFIFYWIAFNAAYADDIRQAVASGERNSFEDYFAKLIGLDKEHRIYNAIWEKFSASIRVILDNRFVFQPFWNHLNGMDGYEDWEERLTRSRARTNSALQRRDTHAVLGALFDRLYVLRNQLVHGGATWKSEVNRAQVRDGAAILAFLLPIFIDLMMSSPGTDWGAPFYPVVNE